MRVRNGRRKTDPPVRDRNESGLYSGISDDFGHLSPGGCIDHAPFHFAAAVCNPDQHCAIVRWKPAQDPQDHRPQQNHGDDQGGDDDQCLHGLIRQIQAPGGAE